MRFPAEQSALVTTQRIGPRCIRTLPEIGRGCPMQLTEVSIIGIRSAVIQLRHPTEPLTVLLFPMIHMGKPTFYRNVTRLLRQCDVVVAEGIDRPSSTGYAYVLAARLTLQHGARQLVRQDIDYEALGIPVIWPDTCWGGSGRMGGLGLLGWLDVVLFTPVLAIAMLMGGRNWLLKLRLEISDNSEVRAPFLDHVLRVARDADLLDALDQVLVDWHGRPATIAVVYGAAHMPAVVPHLTERHGFRARGGEWLDVITF